ncbi:MAG: cytochrome c-type bioproteinis protein [Bacillota bacterium]|nr:MAG: cytochrome c-type bioproteinis protein [Bacillota bacterium]MBS3950187.1 cytochrome c biogenesis protein CcdA [Peptococcaceae bacterium]
MWTLESLQGLLSGSVPLALLVAFVAGVFTSVSPCIMAMVPMVLGYVGAFGEGSTRRNFLLVLSLVLGLATAFAALGIIAVAIGGIFGNVGRAAPLFLGIVLVLMGLNLMQLLHLPFKGLSRLPVRFGGIPGAFVVGLFFGIAASPCASGVLVIILSLVGVSQRYVLGGVLLFAYGLGHGLPLLIVGTAAGALKGFRAFSRFWDTFAYIAGLLFVGVGVYLLALNI